MLDSAIQRQLFNTPESQLLFETMLLLIDESKLSKEELTYKKQLVRSKPRSIDEPYEIFD